MEKGSGSKNLLKAKASFKWVFMDIIPGVAPKVLTSETKFSNCLLIVDEYSKNPKLYGLEIITK